MSHEQRSAPADAPIVVLVRLRLHPGTEDEFASEMRATLRRVREEPACLSIAGHRDPADPSRVMLVETWRSAEAFREFESGREYMNDYMARVQPMWSEPRELSFWQQVA